MPCTDEYFYKIKDSKDGLRPDCKECTKKKSAKWGRENKERKLESNKKYYKTEKGRENQKRVYKQRIENGKLKNWQRNNKDKIRQYRINREAHKKHEISKTEWDLCKQYFNNKCAYCGLDESKHYRLWYGKLKQFDLHKEHVDDNGANDLSNCVPSCQSCNSKKRTIKFEDWYNEKNPKFAQERLSRIHRWLKEDYMKYKE